MVRVRHVRFKFLLLLIVTVSCFTYVMKVYFRTENLHEPKWTTRGSIVIGGASSDPAAAAAAADRHQGHLEAEVVTRKKSYWSDEYNVSVRLFPARDTLNSSELVDLFYNADKLDLAGEIQRDLATLARERHAASAQVRDAADAMSFKSVFARQRRLKPNPASQFLIVEYTNVFFKPKFCDKTSDQIFHSEMERCPFSNCVYSCDKSAQNVQKADALLFHQRDLESEYNQQFSGHFPSWLQSTRQLPFKSAADKLSNNPDQVWVLWNDEATPVHSAFNQLSALFNWTLSYKTDSEVFEGSYGFFVPNVALGTPSQSPTAVATHALLRVKRHIYVNDFVRRRNAVLWFVSNCKSKQRIQIALDLAKHYPVHIYGKCDPVESISTTERLRLYPHLHVTTLGGKEADECAVDSVCERVKLADFKYYLAFENQNCSDYVTEKIWRSLSQHIIPIVLQPTASSYQRYSVPARAFIHLEKFDFSVKELALHLTATDRSFALYYERVKWTYVYMHTVYDARFVEPHRMCDLCKRLNTYANSVSYTRIADFFNYRCKI